MSIRPAIPEQRKARCPQCIRNHDKEIDLAYSRLGQSYGHIDCEDFITVLREIDNMENRVSHKTLTEHWDIFWDDEQNLIIRYYAICEECGFEVGFELSKDFFCHEKGRDASAKLTPLTQKE
jgi:hypothetical protein